jgi:hypothetical protein
MGAGLVPQFAHLFLPIVYSQFVIVEIQAAIPSRIIHILHSIPPFVALRVELVLSLPMCSLLVPLSL